MKKKDRIKDFIINIRKSIERFPITILVSTVLTILLIYYREALEYTSFDELSNLTRICMVVGLGIPLSLIIGLMNESLPKKSITEIGYYIFGGIVLIGYYFILLKDIEMVSMTRYLGTMIFLIITVFYVLKLRKDINYEVYVIKIFSALFLTILYCGVLFGGIAAIFGTIDGLFDVNIDSKYYYYTFLIVGFIFGVSMLLSKLPEVEEDFIGYNYSRSLNVLLTYIVIPLISVYTLIIYVYFIKILIGLEWPRGLVSHLVIWYSAISVGVIFLITPVLEENKIAKLFRNIFPLVNLPILLMMFISIYQRIDQYGITENRYFIVVLGLWITAMMMYFNLRRPLKNILIPISLSILVLISIYGPLSSYSTSKSSQNTRFNKILRENSMLENGAIISNPNLDLRTQGELSNIINYFVYSHSIEDLKVLPKGFQVDNMESIFGFKYMDYTPGSSQVDFFQYYTDSYQKPINISGYDYFINMSSYGDENIIIGSMDVKYDRGNKSIIISEKGEQLIHVDVNQLATIIHEQNIGREPEKNNYDFEDMTLTRENGNIRIKIIFTSIYGNIQLSTGELILDNTDFILMIGKDRKSVV